MREVKASFAEELYDKMWKTKGTRFNAYERLRRRQKRSFYATGLLSAYLIIINLLQPFGLLKVSSDSNLVSFISIALSIILLVFVSIENAADYSLKGNNFHNSAKDIGKLFNELHLLIDKKVTDIKEYEEISEKYSNILDKYDNHSPIDYAVHKTKHQNEFNLNNFERQWILFKANYLIDFHYFAFMFIPPILYFVFIK